MNNDRLHFGMMAANEGPPGFRVTFSNGATWTREWLLALVAIGEWAHEIYMRDTQDKLKHGMTLVSRAIPSGSRTGAGEI